MSYCHAVYPLIVWISQFVRLNCAKVRHKWKDAIPHPLPKYAKLLDPVERSAGLESYVPTYLESMDACRDLPEGIRDLPEGTMGKCVCVASVPVLVGGPSATSPANFHVKRPKLN